MGCYPERDIKGSAIHKLILMGSSEESRKRIEM